jgi:hypothetical protein
VADYETLAKPIIAQITDNLTRQADRFTAYAVERARSARNGEAGLADPIVPGVFGAPPYPYWDMLMYGPFQPLGAGAAGPFLPNKVIKAGEPAFLIGVLWRNPAPVNWIAPGPSAAILTASMNFQVRFETINLTTVTNGPDLGPFTFAPIGLSPVTAFIVPLTPITSIAPADGSPNLYEINMVADVVGPVAGLPFAGYSTWVFDPDFEPPFLFLPPVAPALQHDIPARLLIYTA